MHVHVSATEKKRRLMQTIVQTMKAKAPALLEEWVQLLREVTKNQIDKSEVDGYGHMRIGVPNELFFVMRNFIPDFGDDDKDIKLLAKEFPDLVYLRDKVETDKGPKPGWKRETFKRHEQPRTDPGY
jgi:hypothetical protein